MKINHRRMKSFLVAAGISGLMIGNQSSFISVKTAFAEDGWIRNAQDIWEYYENDELVKSRWIEDAGNWYYVNKKGERLRNVSAEIKGNYYAFDSEGRLLTGGWVYIQADRDDPTKKVKRTWYYAGDDGKLLVSGWHDVNGGLFYFGKKGGVTRSGVISVTEGEDTRKFLIDEEKGRLGNTPGWFSVESSNSDGTSTTVWYFAREDASIYAGDWYPIDGHTIYFNADGQAQFDKWFKIGDERVLVDENGDRVGIGWASRDQVDSNGNTVTKWYYIQEDMSRAQGGFYEIDGATRYFDSKGVNIRGGWHTDSEKRRYYLDPDGALQKNGWFSVTTTTTDKTGAEKTKTSWYYADENGAVLVNGEHEIEGRIYYFSDKGVNLRKAFRKVGSRRKYYGEDGAMKRGEWFSVTSYSTVTGPATMEMEEDEITTEKETRYYADDEGYVLSSTTKVNSTVTIDGEDYSIKKSGAVATGWQQDDLGYYTYYGANGVKAYGWMEYEIPDSWLSRAAYYNYVQAFGRKIWVYFDPAQDGKAVSYRAHDFGEVVIEGHVYGVNARGLSWRGWCATQNTKSGMLRYHYYMPETANGLLQGERAVSCAVLTPPPLAMSQGTDPTWYYFDGNGDIIHAEDGKNELIQVDGQRYIVVDMYGRTKAGLAYSGFDRMPVQKVYYLDPEDQNRAITGIEEVTLPDGRKEMFAFGSDGVGITGERDGYLYYKGRRQIGSGIRAVEIVRNEIRDETEQIDTWIVDSDGRILKDAADVQGDGGSFSSNASGRATQIGGRSERAIGPQISDMSAYIGEVGA